MQDTEEHKPVRKHSTTSICINQFRSEDIVESEQHFICWRIIMDTKIRQQIRPKIIEYEYSKRHTKQRVRLDVSKDHNRFACAETEINKVDIRHSVYKERI